MPPRRPPKHPKSTKLDPTNPTYTPTTYAEALDAGVTVEEKGEKFRWSDPVRSGRWYERAEGLYAMAMGMSSRRDGGWDAGYNR